MRFTLCLLLSLLLCACSAVRSPGQTASLSQLGDDNASSSMAAETSSETEADKTSSAVSQPENTASVSSAADKSSSSTAKQSTINATSDPSGSSQADTVELQTLTLTIPEGYTLARIGMTLEEMGVCTTDEFINAAQNGDFSSFPLVAAQTPDSHRCFKLEGYLYPDTYEIYATDSPDTIIRRILTHTEQKIDSSIRQQISASGYTIDQIITMASIIEKEAYGAQQMPMISSVVHNRLNQGIRLQCDVSIVYVEGAIKPFISGDVNRYNAYYNTYKCDALPVGAICNPSLSAIRAALSPAQSNYLYFVTDENQNYYYAETWEDHQKNLVTAGLTE